MYKKIKKREVCINNQVTTFDKKYFKLLIEIKLLKHIEKDGYFEIAIYHISGLWSFSLGSFLYKKNAQWTKKLSS